MRSFREHQFLSIVLLLKGSFEIAELSVGSVFFLISSVFDNYFFLTLFLCKVLTADGVCDTTAELLVTSSKDIELEIASYVSQPCHLA